jgi:hypothetical protein
MPRALAILSGMGLLAIAGQAQTGPPPDIIWSCDLIHPAETQSVLGAQRKPRRVPLIPDHGFAPCQFISAVDSNRKIEVLADWDDWVELRNAAMHESGFTMLGRLGDEAFRTTSADGQTLSLHVRKGKTHLRITLSHIQDAAVQAERLARLALERL